LLQELEFTALIKEYLPPETSPAIEVRDADEVPAVGDRVFLLADPSAERMAVWTGSGPVVNVPLDGRLQPLLANPSVQKITADLKTTILQLRRRGFDLAPPYDDPLMMAFLLFPNRGKYALGDVVFDLFGQTLSPDDPPVWWLAKVFDELAPRVEREAAGVYRDIERPLASVLSDMERVGIAIDTGVLKQLSEEMAVQVESLTRRIHASAGFAFNINSPRQLGEVLFERLHLPHSKKLKKSGQYSTAVEVLEELAKDYELPRLVLEYRQLAKFQSTYVDVLPTLVDPADGRLHTSFNQGGAATGRLSSTNPNLQNIPVRTELGRKIRRAFIPEPGWRFVAADYSQVELRILAHLSGDEKLIEAFASGEDVHRRTAAEVLGAPIEAVTPEQRERAKAVNFGIVYGQTPYGLAQQLGISPEEAGDFIDRYFARYRGVQTYIAACLGEARDTGVTRTLFGRVRQHPEINASNGMRRAMAERMAINSPIQGTAADIVKLAMIRIDGEIRGRGLRTRMSLQVHDELIFEAPEDEPAVGDLVRDVMQNVVALRVPLTVDLKQGLTWEELG
jgi:DNA polymerase-1